MRAGLRRSVVMALHEFLIELRLDAKNICFLLLVGLYIALFYIGLSCLGRQYVLISSFLL